MSYLFRRLTSTRENPGIRLVVFDFDGTLADTRNLILKIISKHLISFELSLTKDFIKKLGDVPLEKYLYIIGVPSVFVKSVASTIQKEFIREYRKLKPGKNISSLKLIDARKIIVSNNTTSFIEKSLNFMKANFFNGVYGADRFKNKVAMIRSLSRKYKLSTSEIVYVGDKAIDARIAKEVGCYGVIVSNKISWSPRKDVVKEKPDYIIKDLGKLPSLIAKLNMEQLSTV